MISALYRYPKKERRAVAQLWARRSNAVQSAARIARAPDAETVRARALHDARGQIGQKARETVERDYSLKVLGQRLCDIVREQTYA